MKDLSNETPLPTAIRALRRSFKSGVWEVELVSPDRPDVEIRTDLGDVLAPEIREGEGGVWRMRMALPQGMISEGIQTFVAVEAATGAIIASLPVLVGSEIEDELRAEMDLMRAELDLLKKAFRRHCAESM